MNAFIIVLEMNMFCPGDKHVEGVLSNLSHTHTQLATGDFQTELCQDDCYSQVLTSKNGWYHTLVLTSEYTTPTSYIYTIAFSAGLGLQVD